MSSVNRNPVEIGSARLAVVGKTGAGKPNGSKVANGSADDDKASRSRSLATAVSLHLEGKAEEALRELRKAVERGESKPAMYSAMGHILYELQRYQEAVEAYSKLVEVEPHHRTGYFKLAVCLEKLGRWDEAAANFRKALQISPGNSEAQLGLGICLLHLENSEQALEAFDRHLSQDPDARDEAGWRTETFAQIGDGFTARMPYYFRTFSRWVEELTAARFAIVHCQEPPDPETGKPLSLLIVARRL